MNGYTVASFFAGCGGTALGFEWAGFRSIYANEFVPAAADTFEANFPFVRVDRRDIREVAFDLPERPDVLEGSPPCGDFSLAGRRSSSWGQTKRYSDTRQRTDDLFDEFIRLVGEAKPRVFLAENVVALAQGVAIGHFERALAAFRAAGYVVAPKVVDAQWLGVPQHRARVFFLGFREDLGLDPNEFIPRPRSDRVSLGEVLDGLPEPEVAKVGYDDAIPENVAPTLEGYAVGVEWDKLRPGEISPRFFSLRKAKLDEPSPTLTAVDQAGAPGSVATVVHPTQKRRFTIQEGRRIMGFPDDFVLTGSYRQQWERLGRAVPPPVAFAFAREIERALLTVDGWTSSDF